MLDVSKKSRYISNPVKINYYEDENILTLYKHTFNCSHRSFSVHLLNIKFSWSCDGRVVKALDLKSNGVSPRRFEPYSQRLFFFSPSVALSRDSDRISGDSSRQDHLTWVI